MTADASFWGFYEDEPLMAARAEVISAIQTGDPPTYRAAWGRYQELAEAQIEKLPDKPTWARLRRAWAKTKIAWRILAKSGPVGWHDFRIDASRLPKDNPHAKAQIGLIFAKADIWRECRDRARYWRELVDATDYGDGMDYDQARLATTPALRRAEASRSFYAEYLQARRRFEEAIEAYIDREQDECLTDRERGLVNLRLAECYDELLDEATGVDYIELRLLQNATLESAMQYLQGEPEFAQTERMLDDYLSKAAQP
jgi:hypothetical protein